MLQKAFGTFYQFFLPEWKTSGLFLFFSCIRFSFPNCENSIFVSNPLNQNKIDFLFLLTADSIRTRYVSPTCHVWCKWAYRFDSGMEKLWIFHWLGHKLHNHFFFIFRKKNLRKNERFERWCLVWQQADGCNEKIQVFPTAKAFYLILYKYKNLIYIFHCWKYEEKDRQVVHGSFQIKRIEKHPICIFNFSVCT